MYRPTAELSRIRDRRLKLKRSGLSSLSIEPKRTIERSGSDRPHPVLGASLYYNQPTRTAMVTSDGTGNRNVCTEQPGTKTDLSADRHHMKRTVLCHRPTPRDPSPAHTKCHDQCTCLVLPGTDSKAGQCS
ncbi:hypothetical protein BaRGS_00009884 [Batillaria attramentaria]|uniref:Uncharacterized protein n=1 Tax=Batillaria attramentaria TaxID=370345 RepID=A0ABD0LIA6_9CAEN